MSPRLRFKLTISIGVTQNGFADLFTPSILPSPIGQNLKYGELKLVQNLDHKLETQYIIIHAFSY